MRHTLFTLLLLCSFVAFSQSTARENVRDYLANNYQQTVQENPGLIAYLEFVAANKMQLIKSDPNALDFPEVYKKEEDGTVVKVSESEFVEDMNSTSFNPLRYIFPRSKVNKVYQLTGSKKCLLIVSDAQLQKEFKS